MQIQEQVLIFHFTNKFRAIILGFRDCNFFSPIGIELVENIETEIVYPKGTPSQFKQFVDALKNYSAISFAEGDSESCILSGALSLCFHPSCALGNANDDYVG